MRDFMIRGGAISVDHLAELHRAADDLAAASTGLVGGDFGGPATSVWSGDGGRQRAPQAMRDGIDGVAWRNRVEVSTEWLAAHAALPTTAVDVIYAAAQRAIAAAGPLPLASVEPWAEGDEVYRQRLERHPDYSFAHGMSRSLDGIGGLIGLPRARLVPVEK